jgi:hypothetical protein
MVPVLWFLAAAALAGVPAVATPPSELSLVPDAVPSLVAETSTLLYYPLLQHVFHTATSGNSSGASVEPTAAILLRAQTSPDVDVPCSDSTFVSYDGRTWQPTVPESGTSKYGPLTSRSVCATRTRRPSRGAATVPCACRMRGTPPATDPALR